MGSTKSGFTVTPWCNDCQTPDIDVRDEPAEFVVHGTNVRITYNVFYSVCNKCLKEWISPEQIDINHANKTAEIKKATDLYKLREWLKE